MERKTLNAKANQVQSLTVTNEVGTIHLWEACIG